jgi:hypothetical protein
MREPNYFSMMMSLAGIAFGVAVIFANILGWWPT